MLRHGELLLLRRGSAQQAGRSQCLWALAPAVLCAEVMVWRPEPAPALRRAEPTAADLARRDEQLDAALDRIGPGFPASNGVAP